MYTHSRGFLTNAPDCLRSAETSRHSTGLRRPIPLLETRSLLPELLKIEVHKVEDLEQRRRPDLIYEGFPQVIAERDSLKDQLSEANRKIADLENMARAFQIRQLEDELAKKAEENQWLKSQLDRKGKEFAKLRNNIRSAYTDMEKAVATLGSAFMFTVKSPPENGNDYSYDLLGAMPSAGDDMWLKYLSDGDDK
ncbi:hypothetical protein OIU74_023439 [Salix koriyanagi]|uniref:Uncharacterized protein n=1 Tax=Salix koriyanagi TaxID=2511006 RepID=A0A9Q1AB50_9ROSI|nr:hypothetical protein OIU74_023439 [Salix koriyanagi]